MNRPPQTGLPDQNNREPIFLLPGSVAILSLLLLAIYAAYDWSLDEGGKNLAVLWLGYLPVRLSETGLPGGSLPMLWTPVTHAFLHASWSHVLLNVAWLAIFGTPVARRYGGMAMLVVFLVSAVAGALFYTLLQIGDAHILIGASGGVSGLTGVAMRFIFQLTQVARDPESGQVVVLGKKLASWKEMWSNSRTRTFTLFWVGINLAIPVYDLFSGGGGIGIAWQAHIGGFVIGLLLPGLFERKKR
jgi:membrane associated rhomboid family serine protease